MKIPVGIGPSIDISIAGEDTLSVSKLSDVYKLDVNRLNYESFTKGYVIF